MGDLDIQHSFDAHFALPLSGPQFPAKTPDTKDNRVSVVKRIMIRV